MRPRWGAPGERPHWWVFRRGPWHRSGARHEGLGNQLVASFDNQDHQDDAPIKGTASAHDEDWTSLPLSSEVPTQVRTPVEIVDALAATPAELERMLAGVSTEVMSRPAHDGEASVVELVAHLRDWDAVVGDWVARMLEDSEPPMLGVPDDSLWAIEHDYPSQDPNVAASGFFAQRAILVEMLAGLSASAWHRVAIMDGGEQTLQEILDGLSTRDAGHLDRIREALA